MNVFKTVSSLVLNELKKNAQELRKIGRRISSGKLLPQDSPTSWALSRTLSVKIASIESISQHISKTTAVLQKYEYVLSQVISWVSDMKNLAERASLANTPNEFEEIQNAYKERFQSLWEIVRTSRIFGKAIARGGFSNSVLKVERVSGNVDFKPTDFDVSGINFRKFVSEYGRFEVVVRRIGNTFTLELIVDAVVRASETKDVVGVDGAPFTVDFENIGVSINIPQDGDFEVRALVEADPILSILGEGEDERFFLPPLEPDFLSIPTDFSEGIEKVLGDIDSVFAKLSEIKGFIGEKISKLRQQADLNLTVKAKHSILFGQLSDADIPSETVLLNLKQTLISANMSTIGRAIAMLSHGIEMLRR